MIAAFFHDERFTRDGSDTYYTSGCLPYRAFARYLKHFDRIVVVGRLGNDPGPTRTVASGEGLEWACIEARGRSLPAYLAVVSRRVREVLARVDCAIVRLPGVIGPLASHHALSRGTPWMAEVVGDALSAMWTHGSWRGKAAAVPMYLVNRHYSGQAPFATYVTSRMLQRRYPPSGTWVAASNVLLGSPRKDVLERRLALLQARSDGAPAVVGLVGSYDVRYKGHETALRAIARLQRLGRPVTLRCIGGGDSSRWRARAAALGVERWVELGPALPHGDVFTWMDALDLCIAPSLTEGLPRAVIEAMSRALPVVASRVGGIPELLDPSVLHRRRDDGDLARVVGALVGSNEHMRTQARRNWQVACEYSADVIEARRDSLFEQFKQSIAASRGLTRAGCP